MPGAGAPFPPLCTPLALYMLLKQVLFFTAVHTYYEKLHSLTVKKISFGIKFSYQLIRSFQNFLEQILTRNPFERY